MQTLSRPISCQRALICSVGLSPSWLRRYQACSIISLSNAARPSSTPWMTLTSQKKLSKTYKPRTKKNLTNHSLNLRENWPSKIKFNLSEGWTWCLPICVKTKKYSLNLSRCLPMVSFLRVPCSMPGQLLNSHRNSMTSWEASMLRTRSAHGSDE